MAQKEFQAQLDEETKSRLNSFDPEQVGKWNPYHHEIVWYGTEALVHCCVLNFARPVSTGEESLEKFLEEMGMKGLRAPVKVLKNNGIFVPSHVYDCYPFACLDGEFVRLFSGDYRNLFLSEYRMKDGLKPKTDDYLKNEKKYLEFLEFLETSHKVSDFQNPGFVNTGIRLSREMWEISVQGFEEGLERKPRPSEFRPAKPQPQEVTELGRKLIAYYSQIVSELEE